MRHTRQRAAILSILQQTDTHPTAEWVFQEARKTLPRISLGTVYRALDALSAEGIVVSHAFGHRARRYDGSTGAHAHIICTECGRIEDVARPVQAEWQEAIARETGFHVEGQRVEWYGLCPVCHSDSARATE